MRTQNNLDANGSFSATITDGVATLKAKGTATRNWIRFNAGSNGGIFSCYESGQGDVCLYKLEGSGTDEIIISDTTPTPIPTFKSLEELCAAELESGTEVTVTLTDEEIVEFYVSSKGYTNGVYLMVGDQKIEIYCNNVPSTWEIGGTISGTVTCQWKLYNGIWELCPGNWNDFTYTAPSSDEDDEDDDYTWPNPVTFNFGELLSLEEWTSTYMEHTVDYRECTVTFSSANKQANTITDAPVTKGQPVTVVMKGDKKIKSLELVCRKWAAKAQTITLNISKDGGETFTATSITSSDFDLVANELEEGVNAVKFTFSSSSNQIGICSLQIKY